MRQITDEMLVGRRGFVLGSAGLLFAQPALATGALPTLYGDGVHDDAPGLNALLQGKPFRTLGDSFLPLYEDGWAALKGGTYLLGGPLKSTARFHISKATFLITDDTLRGDRGRAWFDADETLKTGGAYFCHNTIDATRLTPVDVFAHHVGGSIRMPYVTAGSTYQYRLA